MKIEGISEASAPQLTGHAFEHHVPARTATTQRTARPAQDASTSSDAALHAVTDVHDSAVQSAPRQEVVFQLPRRAIVSGNDQQGVIDRNGDGLINLGDLPFDYFHIARQANRKPITPPAQDIPF